MAEAKTPMTTHGKEMLEKELKRLMHEERPDIIKSIEEARSHGDLSENAEYDAAKERQALCEGRINDIQAKIATAEVVDVASLKSDRIVFGATVRLQDCETETEVTYQIVGLDEADVRDGKISVLSPLARALIGKRTDDVVIVQSPKGDKEYEILGFEFK